MYDPADATGGKLLTVRKPLLDLKTGAISYIMPKAGRVRMRAGIKNGPLLSTIIDWEPRRAGKNTQIWDGQDKAGLINLLKNPGQELFVFAYSLPDNSIILKSATPAKQAERPSTSASMKRRPRKPGHSKAKYKHALHDQRYCHEPKFDVRFPGSVSQTADGIPILNGIAPVKVVISERDRQHLESARFEVMFFVDTVFLFEDEEGFTPFTYRWNTQDLPQGEHIFTVNILSYDDHCGTVSRKIMIRR